MAIVHTHDRFYLEEERYERPKEIFKWLAKRAADAGLLAPGKQVVDLGCAAGEFLYHLNKMHPGPDYTGIDLLPELIDKASKMVPAVKFRTGSVLDPELLPPASADCIFMVGVHSYFDAARPWLENLVRWTKPGGTAWVFGIFNPYAVDVFLKYQLPGDSPETFRPGWNNWSRRTISGIVDELLGPGRHRYHEFEIGFDLPPPADDPIRSWTYKDERGRRWFTNGLCIIQHQAFLELNV